MPKWPWQSQQKVAPAAPAPTAAPAAIHDINFFVKVADGRVGGTVRVTMSPPHTFVPPPLEIAIQEAAAKVLAPATVGTIDSVVARADMDLYQSASSKFKEAEGMSAPGFQIVRIVIERKQLGDGEGG